MVSGAEAGLESQAVCGLPSSCLQSNLQTASIVPKGPDPWPVYFGHCSCNALPPELPPLQPGLCSSPQGRSLLFSGTMSTSKAGRTGAASPSRQLCIVMAALYSATKR